MIIYKIIIHTQLVITSHPHNKVLPEQDRERLIFIHNRIIENK